MQPIAGQGLTNVRKPSLKLLDQIQRGSVQLGRTTLLTTTAATTRTQTTVNPQGSRTPATRHHRPTTRPTALTEPIPAVGPAPAIIAAPNSPWARTQPTGRRAARRTPLGRDAGPGDATGRAAGPPSAAGDAGVARTAAPGDGAVGAGGGRHAQAREVRLGRDGAGAHWTSDGVPGQRLGVELPPEPLQLEVERQSPCWPVVERAHVCCEAARPARSASVVVVWRSIAGFVLVVVAGWL
ncbi:hypothetical protein PspLS_08732 [Pyricularia sp. CBS 133598]|nr:hypothetical protein PspLS_08732 [Pyricularia sp. CBS 133598]